MITKDQLRELLEGLTDDDLRTLRAIINGTLSKRTITPEQQAKMQAVRIANDSIYGLQANLWTRDVSRAHRLSRRLKSAFDPSGILNPGRMYAGM